MSRTYLKFATIVVAIVVAASTTGCDGTEEDLPLEVTRADDVPADPPTGRDPDTGAPVGTTGRYTFFDMSSNQVILDRDDDDRSDSTSTKWDVGFHSTTLIVNSSATGGGSGGVQVVDVEFADLTEAPESGYSTESVGLESSSDVAWGLYDPVAMLVLPRAGKTLVVRTADGNYAKMRVISYYRGAPTVPDPFSDQERYYTFEYVYQPNGSREFPQ